MFVLTDSSSTWDLLGVKIAYYVEDLVCWYINSVVFPSYYSMHSDYINENNNLSFREYLKKEVEELEYNDKSMGLMYDIDTEKHYYFADVLKSYLIDGNDDISKIKEYKSFSHSTEYVDSYYEVKLDYCVNKDKDVHELYKTKNPKDNWIDFDHKVERMIENNAYFDAEDDNYYLGCLKNIK